MRRKECWIQTCVWYERDMGIQAASSGLFEQDNTVIQAVTTGQLYALFIVEGQPLGISPEGWPTLNTIKSPTCTTGSGQLSRSIVINLLHTKYSLHIHVYTRAPESTYPACCAASVSIELRCMYLCTTFTCLHLASCAHEQKAHGQQWVWLIGVANINALFVMLVGRAKGFEAHLSHFFADFDDLLCLRVAQMSRSLDLAIFVVTTDDRPIALPLAHARGVNISHNCL